MTTQPSSASSNPSQPSGDLGDALRSDVAALVREEITRLRTELGGSARGARTALILLGGAGVAGTLALGASAAFTLRVLDTFLPRPAAAALTTVLYGAGAGLAARSGLAALRQARQQLPSS